MFFRIVSLVLVSLAFTVQATGLTLKEALGTAHQESPHLRALDADISSAQAEKMKALAAHLPHLTAGGRYLLDDKFESMTVHLGGGPLNFPFIQPYSQLLLRASLLLFDGLASYRHYQAAALGESATEAHLEREGFQLEEEVRLRFYSALGTQILSEVAEENVRTLENHLNNVKVEMQSGVSTKFDLLRVEVQLEDAKTDLLAAQDNIVIAENQLAQTMGVEKLTGPLHGRLPVLPKSVIQSPQLDIASRMDRKAQIARTERAEALSRASKGFWYPSFSIYGQQDWYDNVTRHLDSSSQFRNAYEVGVLMSWNLFDGGASLANERQLAAEAAKMRQETRALELSIPKDIDFWKRRLAHSLAVFEAAGVNVQKAEESVRLSRSGVKAGVRTNTEVLDAERDLNQARAKVIRAQIDAIESLARLELALGRPFVLPGLD